jgi:negative regulator of sigma E activity
MSDRTIRIVAAFLAAALAARAHAQSPGTVEELLARADRVRSEWPEAAVTINVTTTQPGAPPSSGRFEVLAKGFDRALIRFVDPKEKGRMLLTRGNEAWLLLPGTKNPIKVPKSQRLRGGFAAADVSKTRFVDDYDAHREGVETLDGRECQVIRLTAKKGKSPSYPVARVWVDSKEALYRKAIFLLASGRTAKQVGFDAYKPYHGVLSLAQMTITDELRPGKTVVEYTDYEKRSLADALFDPMTARQAVGEVRGDPK